MSGNLTPQQVVETLSQIGRDIDDQTDNIAELDEAAVRARVAYKVAHAEAFLRTEGSMDLRRYTADYVTRDKLLDLELAEQQHRAAQSQIRALRDRLEVGRSISALVRMEWGSS
jgi:hypothetical protein